MIFRLALRSLSTHPVRSLVLACGFGLGVGVMAMLLGVGEVILDQARSPALGGAGDVVIASSTGQLPSARWILSSGLRTGGLEDRVEAASPSRRATLYLVKDGQRLPIRAQGGIPSLERAVGDSETAAITSWTDAESDAAWSSPDPGAALMALDRFHAIPDVPARADSWAEWLYFNGRAGDNRFYLTFMVGPARAHGKRAAGVRLQLDRAGKRSSYSQQQEVNEAEVLSGAPDLTIGSSQVRLNGLRYHITLDLPSEVVSGFSRSAADRISGDLFIDASPGRALPPLTIRGAGGWLSGYVVPVLSGRLSGQLTLLRQGYGGRALDSVTFDDGAGYHDHNWGFWKDVSWRWGQVQHGDLSLVYGRIRPPADAADAERIPGFLAAMGPDGPVGYATNVSIEETNDPDTGRPRTIVVTGRSESLDVAMELSIDNTLVTETRSGFIGGGMDFLQLRATYRVRGSAAGRPIDFTAPGSAETFRGR
ncbi:MAG: hypothetical protein EHM55_12100 [Acidobacteria bacterium]|nr:MAG: hypothetical protein EHM55_12100 [Acidobacteriota bacterium]